jgi:hypothetical protein
MGLMGKGYDQFQGWVKQVVILEALLTVLERDKKMLPTLKMHTVMDELFDQVMEHIVKDIAQLKKRIRRRGKIISIQQMPTERRVQFTFDGYQYENLFPSFRMKVECEQALRRYLHVKTPDSS